MRRLGIRFRLLLAVFMLISATTFTLGYMGVKIARQFMQTRFEERITFLARYLALNAELGILIDDHAMLKGLASNLMSESDVVGVVITNERNEKLAEISNVQHGTFPVVESPVELKQSREESEAFLGNGGEESHSKVIGKVRIQYSTQGIDRLLSKMGTLFIWLSIGLVALAGIVFYFLSRSLVAPVTELALATREVAQGRLDLRVKPDNLPETRALALAFNAMLDSLASSREALEAANKEMMRRNTLAEIGKFSFMVAHEVKNPLGIIKTSLDLLKQEKNPDYEALLIGYIEDEITRLNRLIEDFLGYARPIRPQFRSVELNGMLRDIIARFEFQNRDEAVTVETVISDERCHAVVDPDLLMRSFDNIMKNAFEASRGGEGVIRIVSCRNNGSWLVDVEDSGTGIPAENMAKIFEPFFTTRSKGTGLGLAYVYQVVTSHGGSIKPFNKDGGGALFRVELPVPGINAESNV